MTTTRISMLCLALTLAGALSASAQPEDEGLPLPERPAAAEDDWGAWEDWAEPAEVAPPEPIVRAGQGRRIDDPEVQDRYVVGMFQRLGSSAGALVPAQATWTSRPVSDVIAGDGAPRPTRLVLNGFELQLDGLTIRHLTAATPADALAFASNAEEVLGEAGRQVVEVRGAEVRILAGERLEDPAFARRALAATWELLPAEGSRQLLSISDGLERYAAELDVPQGDLYASLHKALRNAQRARAELAEPDAPIGATWRSDTDLRVHLPGEVAMEIRVRPDGGLSAKGPEGEIDDLLAYLRAVRGDAAGGASASGAGALGVGLGDVVEEIEREVGR